MVGVDSEFVICLGAGVSAHRYRQGRSGPGRAWGLPWAGRMNVLCGRTGEAWLPATCGAWVRGRVKAGVLACTGDGLVALGGVHLSTVELLGLSNGRGAYSTVYCRAAQTAPGTVGSVPVESVTAVPSTGAPSYVDATRVYRAGFCCSPLFYDARLFPYRCRVTGSAWTAVSIGVGRRRYAVALVGASVSHTSALWRGN